MFIVENNQTIKIIFSMYIFLQYVHISYNMLHVPHNVVPTFKTTYLLGALYIYEISSTTTENIKKIKLQIET